MASIKFPKPETKGGVRQIQIQRNDLKTALNNAKGPLVRVGGPNGKVVPSRNPMRTAYVVESTPPVGAGKQSGGIYERSKTSLRTLASDTASKARSQTVGQGLKQLPKAISPPTKSASGKALNSVARSMARRAAVASVGGAAAKLAGPVGMAAQAGVSIGKEIYEANATRIAAVTEGLSKRKKKK